MRPIKLSMTAFGPYRDAETVDFSLLEDRRLFVISGNTGAGKTTIFDAICYSLYGGASGEDRAEPRLLRSHFADDETYTCVDFHFAVGRRTFRVFRQMPHRKGANKNETGGKAELYETTSGTEVPYIDKFTVSDVNAKLETVIGLTKEQFSQIVMLPQGEFRKLLTSDTENKEDILRRIFRTGLYQKLEERFQRQNRELQDALKQAKAMQEVYMKQAEETLPEREDSALFATLRQEYRSTAAVLDGLNAEADHYEAGESEAERKKAEVAEKLIAREAELRDALALHGRFAQLADKTAQREQMEARKAEVGRWEQSLLLAEQAARIEPYEEQAVQADRLAAEKRAQLERKLADADKAAFAFDRAQERFRAEEGREPERQEAQQRLRALQELVPVVRTLAERRTEVERLLAEERTSAKAIEAADARLAKLREDKRAGAEQLKLVEADASKRLEKDREFDRVKLKYRLLKELLELDSRIAELAKFEAEHAREAEATKARHDELEAGWIEGQAGLLALHLHDGAPCPVCGSEDHPAKATSVADIPSREALQLAKEQLRRAEQTLHEAKAQAAAASSSLGVKEAEKAEYGITSEPFAVQLARAEADGKLLRAETERLKQQAERLQALRESAERLDTELDQLQRDREKLLEGQQRSALERSAKMTLLESELARIPEDSRTPEQLNARIAAATSLARQLADAWQEAQRLLQLAQASAVEEKTNAVQAAKQSEESGQAAELASNRLTEELTKSGFAAREEYFAAKQTQEMRERLRQQIDAFKSGFAALLAQIEELERELLGKAPPELSVLQEAIAESKAALELVSREQLAAQRHKQEAQRLHASIAKAFEQFKDLEQQQQQVADIYLMLKGDNALKISFERYILIEFLEQILHAANVRLQELSGGQFVLQRSGRLETRGKQSGLGLDVYDSYTGQNRDVKSMSGGEKFNASLCLALGMTDVIQAYQGGVSIEMMFIDEGFGSLDEESLHKAIATLIDLQRSGRMIGVISHVQELKQAFPAALEVSKTKEGHSRTAIILK